MTDHAISTASAATARADGRGRPCGGPLRIAAWHNLPSGGGKRALHDHVRGLVARGHHVEAWCPDTADTSYLPLAGLVAEHVTPLSGALEAAAPGRSRPGRVGRILAPYRAERARIEAIDAAARRDAAAIDAGGFDVAFLNTCYFQYAPAVARHLRTPSVLYLQEPDRLLYEARPADEGGVRLPWVAWSDEVTPAAVRTSRKRALGRLAYEISQVQGFRIRARAELENARACGRILCNSLFSREAILRCYGLEARVCYLGVDTDAFRPQPGPKAPYAIGLGSFIYSKGIERAVQALATIGPDRRPELVWVGNISDADYLAEMQDLAGSLGVRLTPRQLVGQGELVDLLGRAAVMVYTSRLEPFGYAPLEANACGTAVAGVSEAGIRETVRTGVNGILVDPDAPDALGRAVLSYTADPDVARREGLRAREHVEAAWGLAPAIERLELELIAAATAAARPGAGSTT